MRNMSQNLELIIRISWSKWAESILRYLLRILSRNEVGFIFLSISQAVQDETFMKIIKYRFSCYSVLNINKIHITNV